MFLGNGLIIMYVKCGVLDCFLKVFDCMSDRDVVSWNVIIFAFAQYGEGKKVVQYFKAIQCEIGIKLDQVIFIVVFFVCSYVGLVCDGIRIFNFMVNDYGLKLGVDYFFCFVDFLGRVGYFDETEGFIEIESEDLKIDFNVWWILFSVCVVYGNVRLGRIVVGVFFQIEKNDLVVYVLLLNIYVNVG